LGNPYLEEIRVNLPRLLSLFDNDRSSISYGMGDRYHWAWGLIDFGNGTFQGAAHGLARLWAAGLWPYATPKEIFISRIDALFHAAEKLTRNDGSLEEAFPREGSYCVTALVAFDLLCVLDLLREDLTEDHKQRWRSIIAPMITYLIHSDETHALISNHLATAVAALLRWHNLTGDKAAEEKARIQLDKILQHQSVEGWFKEYEGADPGYQSLCTYYLADVHRQRPDWNLLAPLHQSIQFLWHFAHPDGSFGGLYGSRCTRFYYPAGVMALANEIPEAAALAKFMESSIGEQKVVTLSAVDEPNLIPMFNAYAWAAVIADEGRAAQEGVAPTPKLPCHEQQPMQKHYCQAGLWLDRGPTHYTIVSTHKGGVVYHFHQAQPPIINAGVVVCDRKGRTGSTQGYDIQNKVRHGDGQLEITSQVIEMPKQLAGPFQFMVLRMLSLTLFRSAVVREWIKRRLVKMLITKPQTWPVRNIRRIQLGASLSIEDATHLALGYQVVENVGAFIPIHMDSQGYWQIQDEEGQERSQDSNLGLVGLNSSRSSKPTKAR
jgi:hypothetical protein